jgi:hypothetical protein
MGVHNLEMETHVYNQPPSGIPPPPYQYDYPAQPPAYPGYYPSPYPIIYQVPHTSGAAVASMICGLLSWVLLPFIGGVIAVVCGHHARDEIRRSNGLVTGDGMAVTGLIFGYLHLIGFVLILGFILLVLVGVGAAGH